MFSIHLYASARLCPAGNYNSQVPLLPAPGLVEEVGSSGRRLENGKKGEPGRFSLSVSCGVSLSPCTSPMALVPSRCFFTQLFTCHQASPTLELWPQALALDSGGVTLPNCPAAWGRGGGVVVVSRGGQPQHHRVCLLHYPTAGLNNPLY